MLRQTGLGVGSGRGLSHGRKGKLPEVWVQLSFSPRQLFSCIMGQQLGHGSFHHMSLQDKYSHCVFLVVYICIETWCVCLCPHREGIQWEAIDWMDNAECLDLIEKVTDSQSNAERAESPPGATAC